MNTVAARSASELIAEIGSWFARDAMVGQEYSVAAAEFFGGSTNPWYAPDEGERNQALGRCSEWFAYHRPSEALGRTPFEHLLTTLAISGRSVDREAMIRFRGQLYGFFEVIKVVPKQQLVLRHPGSQRNYPLDDKNASSWLRKGMVVLTRLFPWEDGYVLSPYTTGFSGKDRWLARFNADHQGLDPQEVEIELFIKRRHPSRLMRDRAEISADLADFLEAFGLRETPDGIFKALEGSESPVIYLNDYLPKVAKRPSIALYDLNDLGTMVMGLWNHAPLAAIGGQTPFALHQEDPARYQAEIMPRLTQWKA